MTQKIPDEWRPRFIRKKGDPNAAILLIHPCCVCGDKNASFGHGVSLRKYPRSLGKWYCSKHNPTPK